MPSARRAGVPPEIVKEWETDFKQKKAEQKQTGGRKLPSGAAQYEHDGVTYTAKWGDQAKGKVNFPEAAYEARVEGARSRKGEQQQIKLGSLEQQLVDLRYKDAQRLSRYLGQPIVVDHLAAIAKGGFSNDPNNLILLTEATNIKKSDSMDFYNQAMEESKYLSQLAADLDGNVDFKGGSATLKPGRFLKPASFGMSMISEYGDVVDELTGGAISNAINTAVVNPLRQAVGQEPVGPYQKPDPLADVQAVKRAKTAVQRGGQLSFGFNGVKFTAPELGLSEVLGLN
jgi:hypothetical protein